MSRETELTEGLKYVAHCLEQRKVYDPSSDSFIVGEAMYPLLSKFAMKLANNELPGWGKWIEQKLKTA